MSYRCLTKGQDQLVLFLVNIVNMQPVVHFVVTTLCELFHSRLNAKLMKVISNFTDKDRVLLCKFCLVLGRTDLHLGKMEKVTMKIGTLQVPFPSSRYRYLVAALNCIALHCSIGDTR